jgi:hypothetical protein
MTTAVRELFQKIESLSDKDRLELDKLLARKVEAKWQAGAKKARAIAKKQKVTLASIDDYIERRRYGK